MDISTQHGTPFDPLLGPLSIHLALTRGSSTNHTLPRVHVDRTGTTIPIGQCHVPASNIQAFTRVRVNQSGTDTRPHQPIRFWHMSTLTNQTLPCGWSINQDVRCLKATRSRLNDSYESYDFDLINLLEFTRIYSNLREFIRIYVNVYEFM